MFMFMFMFMLLLSHNRTDLRLADNGATARNTAAYSHHAAELTAPLAPVGSLCR